MSSEQDPATSFLRGSVGSRSTDLHLHHRYADSPWIRRLNPHTSPANPLTIRQLASIRGSHCSRRSTAHLHNNISTYESRTPLKLPQMDQEEPAEVISGFGPFQFKATNRLLSMQFHLVSRIARFNCEERFMDGRRKGFKLSHLFQFRPPPPPPGGAHFTALNFSQIQFPVKAAEADFHGDASGTAPNLCVPLSEAPNLTNKEDGRFSHCNLGWVNRSSTIFSLQMFLL